MKLRGKRETVRKPAEKEFESRLPEIYDGAQKRYTCYLRISDRRFGAISGRILRFVKNLRINA